MGWGQSDIAHSSRARWEGPSKTTEAGEDIGERLRGRVQTGQGWYNDWIVSTEHNGGGGGRKLVK